MSTLKHFSLFLFFSFVLIVHQLYCILFSLNMKKKLFSIKTKRNISQGASWIAAGWVYSMGEHTSFIFHSSRNLFLVSPPPHPQEEGGEDSLYSLIMMR